MHIQERKRLRTGSKHLGVSCSPLPRGQVDPHRAPELVPWDHDTQPTFLHCSGGWVPAQEEGPDASTKVLAGAQVLSGQKNIGVKNYEETCQRKQDCVHFPGVYWVKSLLEHSVDCCPWSHLQAAEEGGLRARRKRADLKTFMQGFPGGPVVKNPPCNAKDTCLIPGLGRSHTLGSN